MTLKHVCAFVKHRDKIKFERFYDNHPVTYLPFVVSYYMIINLLPSLYTEESQTMEHSRIYLLQECKIGLKVLETFVNATLNIQISLSEHLFEQNINKLKNIKQITREVIYPLLLVEKYLSHLDVITYQTALSSFFPENIVTKSEDLIPCLKFYEETDHGLVGTSLWGPPFWSVLHYASYVVDQKPEYDKSKQ